MFDHVQVKAISLKGNEFNVINIICEHLSF